MRIVGGKHRGRPITAPAGIAVRPTSDRVREAVFNILSNGKPEVRIDWPEATVIDGFAGSGALGLEALSRGAAHVTFIETDRTAGQQIAANIENLGETENATLIAQAVERIGRWVGPQPPVNLVFLDPPYGRELAAPALTALAGGGGLSANCLCVVETKMDAPPPVAGEFQAIDRRVYGATAVHFLKFTESK